jgi:NitT/TauT family transport system substrate-binding protein
VTSGAATGIANAALAQSLGYFKQEGLDVHMSAVAASSTVDAVVSGSADIAAFTVTGALLASNLGKPMTMLYGYQGNHQVGTFITKASIKSLDQLKALSSCKIASGPPGGGLYGYSTFYVKSLGLHCTLTTFGATPQAVAGVVAGSFDGGAFPYGDVADLANQGKVNMLIDTSKAADRKTYLGPGFTSNAWFASTGWVKSHKEAIIRLLRAFAKVDHALHTMTSAQLGDALHNLPDPDWNGTSSQVWALGFSRLLPFLNPDGGYINEANWQTGLETYAGWGLSGYDPKNPTFSYKARVDMSYYESAIGPDPKKSL